MNIEIPRDILSVLNRLQSKGFEAFAVGGCVRDKILGVEPKDWDITTSALPGEVKQVFDDMTVIDTGIKHGTVTVLVGRERIPVEVTTFRTEFGYSDNRRPDRVEFVTSIKDDLSRRDFTMNALACDGRNGDILDLFNGKHDIINRCVRCVGDARIRFEEDALRILRALRFASVLGFKIEKTTAETIHEKRWLLKNIAAERIFSEFKQLICGVDCVRIMRTFRDVFAVFIPEIEPMFDFPQNTKYHCFDVWEHTLHAIDGVPRITELRAAAFFHDCGKPASRTIEKTESGETDHFYYHASVSEKLVRSASERLKTDKKFSDTVAEIVLHHGDCISPTRKNVLRWLNKLGEEQFWRLLAVKRADVLAQAPEYRLERLRELDKIRRIAYDALCSGSCFGIKDLDIDGNDCIALGLRGREIGDALNTVLEAVIDNRINNNIDDIKEFLKNEVLFKYNQR